MRTFEVVDVVIICCSPNFELIGHLVFLSGLKLLLERIQPNKCLQRPILVKRLIYFVFDMHEFLLVDINIFLYVI